MSLEASTLTVRVQSEGIENTTKALNDLAKAGENAEKKTSNIGNGAKASAKAQVDAAEQAASAYNAIIDMMTEKANEFYANKTLAAFKASQQEIFDGMALADKLTAIIQQSQADRAAMRQKESDDIRAKQQQQMDAAQAWYAQQQEMANRMNAAFDKKRDNAAQLAAMKQEEAEWKALTKAADEYYASEKKLAADADKFYANQAKAKAAEDAKKLADANRALRQETERLAAAEAAEQKEQQARASTAESFINSLKRQAEATGLHGQKLRDYQAELTRAQAAQLGLMKAGSDTEKQINSYINTIRNTKGPHESFNLLTAGSARELMVLGHELSQGQFQRFGGSLIVLGERINFLPSLLEKMSEAAKAVGMSFGLFAASIAGVVATIAVLTVAYFKGAAELKAFNAAVVQTGDFAGMTGGHLNQMAIDIGKAVGSMGEAKKIVRELAESGRFTGTQIAIIAPAIAEMSHVTGKSADDMIKQFESIATAAVTSTKRSTDQVSQHILKLNDQYHFLTASQFEQISMLEKEGQAQEAMNMAEEIYAAKLQERAEKLKGSLGIIQQIWMGIKEAASGAWDTMLGIGKKDTSAAIVDRLKTRLVEFDKEVEESNKRLGRKFDASNPEGSMSPGLAATRLKLVNQLIEATVRLNNEDAEAAQKGKEQQEQTAGMHAIARTIAVQRQVSKQSALEIALAEQKVNDELAKQAIARDKLSEDAKVREAAEKASAMYTDEAIAKRNKDITDYYSKKQPKPHTEGLSGLDAELNRLNDLYEVQKRATDNEIKLIDFKNKYGLLADTDAQDQKEELLDKEMALEKEHLEKAIAAINDFHSKDVRLMNDAASKKYNIQKQLDRLMSDIALKQKQNDLVPDVNSAAEAIKQQKEQDNIMKQIEKQTAQVQAQVDAYNRLPDAVKAAGIRQKEMASEVEQSKIDALQAEKDDLLNMDAMYTIVNQRRIDQIDKEIAERLKLKGVLGQKEANDKQNSDALGRSSALTKVATEQIRMWKDVGSEIEKSLKASFGASGEAAGKMFKAFAEGQADQISLLDKARIISENKSLSETEKEKQLQDIRIQSAQNQVGMYGDMANAASTFFDKGSTGYQAMAKAAQVLHTAEVALSIIKGVNAILTQGEGDPYTAFARMAAMTALVAGLGVAITGGKGSGPMSSANQQKIQGTGTVLGSPTITDGVDVKLVGQKSDSIANSLKIAEKNSGLGLVVQNDMLNALNKLSGSIEKFATLAVQNSGLTGITANDSVSGIGNILSKVPVVGGILGKVGTAIFGGKKTVDDTGLNVKSASLAQIAMSGLTANQYTNTTTSGGWFRGDDHDTETKSLGAEFNDQITKIVLNMQDTLKTAATGLGMNADAFDEKLKSFVVDIGNISLKGMTGDEIQKTLENVFSKLGDQMAQFAFSDLQRYQKIGEGLMETVVRVANDLQQVKDVFDSLSKTIPAGVAAIAASEALVTQFGSVDNLTKGVKSYINAIYTDQEKLLPIIKSVNTAMDGLGLSYVKTKEQFKQVVDSLDLTTEAGAKMFAALMNIAPAFAQTIDDTEKLAQDARSALTDAYKRESDAIKETQSKMQDFVKTLKQLTSGSLLGDLSPLTPQQKYLEAKSQFETISQKAQGGDKDAQEQFSSAYSAFLEASKTANASGSQYQKDFQYAQSVAQKLTDWGQKQVDVAQATLDALNKQVEGLINVNDGLLTVSQAIANLIKALKGTPEGDKVANQAASNAQSAIEKLYNDILHRHSDQAGMDFWLSKIKEGVSLTDIANAIANSPEGKGEIKPIGTTSTTQAIAPVTATISTQAASNADVVKAVNTLNTTIIETTQAANNNLIGAVYDSQDKAAEKTVNGVSSAVSSTKTSSAYKIVER